MADAPEDDPPEPGHELYGFLLHVRSRSIIARGVSARKRLAWLAKALQAILDGEDPAKALGLLPSRGRPRAREQIRREQIAVGAVAERMIELGDGHGDQTKAIEDVALRLHVSPVTLKAWVKKHYRVLAVARLFAEIRKPRR